MEKRKLSALPRPEATAEMVEMADRLDGMEHIVTAELVEDNKILLLNFYEVSKLKKGKTEAAFIPLVHAAHDPKRSALL